MQRRTNRAGWWNYSQTGIYFITINIRDRRHYFGTIINDKVSLRREGMIIKETWREISNQFPWAIPQENVIMPDHFHGIICIKKTTEVNQKAIDISGGASNGVLEKNPMNNQCLGTVVRWFKAKTALEIRRINPSFNWQRNYHDVIIRSADQYDSYLHYISNNPKLFRAKR